MADLEKILRMVQDGVLSPDEAEQILAALDRDEDAERAGQPEPPTSRTGDAGRARHLRVEITDHGRQVVKLRVPMNVASFAAGFVPGLPDEHAERIRDSIRSGVLGPIVDISSEDGDRVLIVSE